MKHVFVSSLMLSEEKGKTRYVVWNQHQCFIIRNTQYKWSDNKKSTKKICKKKWYKYHE